MIIATTFILLLGCNRLRIKDFPADSESPQSGDYYTASINYQRNTFSDNEIAPPLIQDWDETLIALPNGGFTSAGNWLFFGTSNGYLGAASLEDGDMKGRRNLGDACATPPSIWNNYIYQPYEDGTSGLIAYDIVNGDKIWQIDDQLSSSSPVIIDNRIFHQTVNSMVFCLNRDTGEMLWQKYLNQKVRNSLAFSNGILVTASMSGTITALSPFTGGTVWSIELKNPIFADPVIVDNTIYVVTYAGNLYAIDLNRGQIIRKRNFNLPLYYGPAIDRHNIYLGLSDGRMVMLDTATFSVLYTFAGEGPVSGPPLITKSYVYYTTLSKFLYILARSDLELLQDMEFDARLRSTPLIKNGKLVIVCENNRVIALAKDE